MRAQVSEALERIAHLPVGTSTNALRVMIGALLIPPRALAARERKSKYKLCHVDQVKKQFLHKLTRRGGRQRVGRFAAAERVTDAAAGQRSGAQSQHR